MKCTDPKEVRHHLLSVSVYSHLGTELALFLLQQFQSRTFHAERQRTFVKSLSYFYTFFSPRDLNCPSPCQIFQSLLTGYLTGRNIFLQGLIYLPDLHMAHRFLKLLCHIIIVNFLMIKYFSKMVENVFRFPHEPKITIIHNI